MSDSKFRPLNDHEEQMITRLIDKGRIHSTDPRATKPSKVSYESMQGGFCVCTLLVYDIPANKTYLYRGASRRSYKDRRNPVRGKILAFSRAVLYSHAVEI